MKIDFSKFQNEKALIMEHAELAEEAEDQKICIFQEYVKLLVKKMVMTHDGFIDPDRHGCYDYISIVIPFLTRKDLFLLQTNPDLFGKKFIFSAGFGRRQSSLAGWLQKTGVLSVKSFESVTPTFNKDAVFMEFTAETGLSPYEKITVHEAEEFLESYEEDFPLEVRSEDD